jgi:hypothetical protein
LPEKGKVETALLRRLFRSGKLCSLGEYRYRLAAIDAACDL